MTDVEIDFATQLATDAVGRTANTFFKAAVSDPASLELRPAFQRNLVWNKRQKSYLIDSMLRGLPVPEVYIQTLTDADGNERLIVVDGQQRISTCVHFIAGELRLDDDEELDPRWRGSSFDELDDDLRARFRSFKFIVRELPSSLGESMLREIFLRLNRTVEALEPQELRHAAFTGPFLTLVESAGDAVALRDLGVFSPKDYLRRRHDEFMSEVFLAVYMRAFPNKKEGLDDLYLTLERQGLEEERGDELRARVGRSLNILEVMAPVLRRTRFRNKSDCYSLLVFMALNAELLPVKSAHIDEMAAVLNRFSATVAELRRRASDEAEASPGLDLEFGEPARQYLISVERAASDRLSRIRRHDALRTVLEPHLAKRKRELTPLDSRWSLASSSDDGELGQTVEEGQEAKEKRALQEALIQGA